MANEYAFPFDSKKDSLGIEDREYGSKSMRDYFSKFVANGVFGLNTNELQVLSTSGMSVKLTSGSCFINGATRDIPETTFALNFGDPDFSRIDAIVLRFDLSQRNIVPLVLQGIPSASPSKPEHVRNDNTWDLVLAYIEITLNAVTISQANITDERGTELCPYVTGLIRTIDSSGLFAQYQAAWNDFIAQLGESDNVTINTEDVYGRKLTDSVRMQQSFGSMFTMI